MSGSEPISRAFYDAIGKDGLSQRTRPDWDEAIASSLLERIGADERVLDVGCGYGRICLPLARHGLDVHGLDLSARLIGEARAAADVDGTPVRLVVGSMIALPYPNASFDVVLCLWSAFHELLAFDEQVQTLAEMRRVLAPRGWALIEGPPYEPATPQEIVAGLRSGPDHRISNDVIFDRANPHFRHDPASLGRAASAAGIARWTCYEDRCAVRTRLFLRFEA